MMAGVASPSAALNRNRHSYIGTSVGHEFVEFLKPDIERVAFRATGLLILTDAIDVKTLRYGLIQDFFGGLDISGLYLKLDPAQEV
jgi:hypothetical protein